MVAEDRGTSPSSVFETRGWYGAPDPQPANSFCRIYRYAVHRQSGALKWYSVGTVSAPTQALCPEIAKSAI